FVDELFTLVRAGSGAESLKDLIESRYPMICLWNFLLEQERRSGKIRSKFADLSEVEMLKEHFSKFIFDGIDRSLMTVDEVSSISKVWNDRGERLVEAMEGNPRRIEDRFYSKVRRMTHFLHANGLHKKANVMNAVHDQLAK